MKSHFVGGGPFLGNTRSHASSMFFFGRMPTERCLGETVLQVGCIPHVSESAAMIVCTVEHPFRPPLVLGLHQKNARRPNGISAREILSVAQVPHSQVPLVVSLLFQSLNHKTRIHICMSSLRHLEGCSQKCPLWFAFVAWTRVYSDGSCANHSGSLQGSNDDKTEFPACHILFLERPVSSLTAGFP